MEVGGGACRMSWKVTGQPGVQPCRGNKNTYLSRVEDKNQVPRVINNNTTTVTTTTTIAVNSSSSTVN